MNTTIALGTRFALDVAVKATVLFAVTGLALFALRRAPAAARHLVATAGLAAALALPLLTLALPRVAMPVLPGLALPTAESVRPSAEPAAVRRGGDDRAPVSDSATVVVRASRWTGEPEPVQSPEPTAASPSPRTPTRGAWLAMALAAWAAGILLVGARLAVGWARVRRIAREADPLADRDWTRERDVLAARLGVRRKVELLESAAVPVAITSGFLRPLLLLGHAARSWAIERRRVVLLHELAHVKRGDWLALLVAEAAVALYWFHPAAWLLAREVRRDGERASDDLVLAAGTKPSVYAGHLLGIFRSLSSIAHPVAPALALVRPSHFEERLRAILDPAPERRRTVRGRAMLSAGGILAAAVLVAVIEPWAPSRAGAAILGPSSDTSASLLPPHAAGQARPAACPKAAIKALPAVAVRTSASVSPAPAVEPVAPSPEPLPESGRSLPAVWKVLPGVARDAVAGFIRAGNGGGRSERSGSEWYGRGMDLHHSEHYDRAIEAFQKAIDDGYREDAASYNIACGYALKGDKDKAFEWLRHAMDLGFNVSAYLGHDDDLESLESDPRWKDLKKTARTRKSTREEDQAKAAAVRFERLSASAPKSGERFFEVGKELLNADRYDLSAKAFQAAADRGYRVGTSLYNGACALSRGGEKRAALDQLQKALDAGFDQPDIFRTDDDLDNVRDEPRFREIAREARDLSLPGYGTDRWSFGSSWKRSQWRETIKKFEDYARAHPEKGRAWFNLGYASLGANRPEAAVEAFQKAVDLGYRKPTSLYNLACSYARADQKDKAFDWLFKALDAGFDASGTLRSDEDLDNLRGDPRFRKALEIARARDKSDSD
jgi:beta-lactamase regulating signal transducer with metallopeptidase domain/tetratricopeptide (TPR) repeat protein